MIDIARKEVGVIEGPKDNQTKYGAFARANFLPWCGSFCMWVANEAKVKIPNTVSTVAGAAAFEKMGTWFEADCGQTPQPGDILYFDFPGDGVNRISHVGICAGIIADGVVATIEGNTSGKKKGDQRNGGEVCLKLRGYKKNPKNVMISIVGFGRPKFGKAAPSSPAPKSAAKSDKCPTCGK